MSKTSSFLLYAELREEMVSAIITFRDYMTSETVAIVKSSGIGWSISQDQKMSLKAIRKELDKVFK